MLLLGFLPLFLGFTFKALDSIESCEESFKIGSGSFSTVGHSEDEQ